MSPDQTASRARRYYVLAAVVAVGTALVLLWMMGALGIIGSGGRPDLLYLGVLAVGVLGSVLGRFRARGMAWALLASAVATVVVGIVALAAGLQDEPGASVAEILGLTLFFAVPMLVSSWLFLQAAEWSRPDASPSVP